MRSLGFDQPNPLPVIYSMLPTILLPSILICALANAAKRYALKAGTVKVSKGNVVLPVRSTGNTNTTVSASATFKSATGTRRASARVPILPGKQLSIELLSAKKLPAGTYTTTVTLKQGTLTTKVKKTLRVKR